MTNRIVLLALGKLAKPGRRKTMKNTQTATKSPQPVAAPDQGSGPGIDAGAVAETGETGTISPVAGSDAASAVIASHPMKGKGTRKGFLSTVAVAVEGEAVEKMALFGKVRQGLSMVADLEREGGDKANEAKAEADRLSVLLYQSRVKGIATADEVSGILGDAFGYKPQKDGKPGKTPMGLGEAIRKRIVRAVKAAEFVADPVRNEDRFFSGLETEDVADVLHQLDEGTRSLWTVYDDLAEMRRENFVRVDKAFDPKAIAGIVGKLAEPGAIKTIAANPALQAAYGELYRMLQIIDETDGEEIAA